jgi:coatomer subunit beta'
MEKIKEYEAHSDFIRYIIIHPRDPYMLTCSDDQTICLWDIERNFQLVRTYEEHKNFVMRIALNPKDYTMFASASMDHRVKIWSMTSNNSHLTLEGHGRGATSVSFCPLNDKPYLASGSDDKTIRIWDYTNRHCVYVLESHEDNISSLQFHPELPILISGAEDSTCKFWNINTFKLEDTKSFGYDTIWDLAAQESQNMIALGCEEGTLVMRMGSDQPLAVFK